MSKDIQNSDYITNVLTNKLFGKFAILSKNVPLTGIVFKTGNTAINFLFINIFSMLLKDFNTFNSILFFTSPLVLKSLNNPLIIDPKEV